MFLKPKNKLARKLENLKQNNRNSYLGYFVPFNLTRKQKATFTCEPNMMDDSRSVILKTFKRIKLAVHKGFTLCFIH